MKEFIRIDLERIKTEIDNHIKKKLPLTSFEIRFTDLNITWSNDDEKSSVSFPITKKQNDINLIDKLTSVYFLEKYKAEKEKIENRIRKILYFELGIEGK